MTDRIKSFVARPVGCFAAALCTGVSLAQTAPPSPSLSEEAGPPAWLGFLIMFVLFAIVISISLMPSKRSHQD